MGAGTRTSLCSSHQQGEQIICYEGILCCLTMFVCVCIYKTTLHTAAELLFSPSLFGLVPKPGL